MVRFQLSQVLVEIGRPMRLDEIMVAARRKGAQIGDGEKAKYNFSSSLSRDKRFRSVHWASARRWWIAGRDLPKQ